jgi:hypothetical protein
MNKSICSLPVAILCAVIVLSLSASAGFAEDNPRPMLDVAFSVSSLGFGVQAAKPLPRRSDLRGGVNFYTYGTDISKDGAHYAEEVDLRSVNFQFDKYVFAGLFVSGGALVWNGNKGDATVAVPAGQSFSLGNKSYISDPASPVHGESTVRVNKFAPMLSLGYGNLTSKGHIAYSAEAGVVFHGTPLATLSLAGSACTSAPAAGLICQNIGTNAGIQNDVAAQQTKLNDDISHYKYYPVIQFSIGYKFK